MPLAESAYQQLRGLILTCELLPGATVTEGHVVDRLVIGKTPVREAMLRLVRDGLLTVTPRAGYTVRPITADDVAEVFQLRQITESATAEMAAIRGVDEETLERLHALCAIGYDAADHRSALDFLRLNGEFHSRIARASGNGRLADVVERTLAESQRLVCLGMLRHPRSHAAQREHAALLDAIRLRDGTSARRVIGAEIDNTHRMVLDSLHDTRSP